MASGGSLPCSGPQVGRCTPSGSSASGGGRGLRSHSSNRNRAGGGATTDPASVSGWARPITPGPMTASWIEHTSDPRSPDGRKFRLLTVIDAFTRRCMAVVVARRLNSDNVLHCLTERCVQPGPPHPIRSDNGSEFTAHAVRDRRGRIGEDPLYGFERTVAAGGVSREKGSPWQNGYERELQLKAPARNPEHGDLPCTEGGQSADRTMAASL